MDAFCSPTGCCLTLTGFVEMRSPSSRSHYPQCWKDGFFNRASLYSLRFVCHLGHEGDACPMDSQPHNLLIVDISGWHKLQVKFCTCGANPLSHERYCQLLQMHWYLASFNRPQTVFSFNLLETYYKVTLQGKRNLYNFYLAIMHKSDNQGRSKPMVRDLQ